MAITARVKDVVKVMAESIRVSSESVLEIAIAKRENLLSELRRCDEFIKTWHDLSGNVDLLKEIRKNSHSEIDNAAQREPRLKHRQRRASTLAITESLVAEILTEHGRPMHTIEIFKELNRRSFIIEGNDPKSLLSARLSRSGLIEHFPPYGWRLKPQDRDGSQISEGQVGVIAEEVVQLLDDRH